MSLYFEASKFISGSNKQRGSLKTRVFADKSLRSKPTQIYGLVLEASKYSPVLKDVIESSGILAHEKKLTPELALLLVHDLLFSKRGIAAPQGHKIRTSVEKHKARLNAELTRYRIRHKFATLQDLQLSVASSSQVEAIASGDASCSNGAAIKFQHPRWVRINRLKTTLEEQLRTTFKEYVKVDDLESILGPRTGPAGNRVIHVDKNIPDLLALPASADLSRQPAYLEGKLILQDKASCFPAYLINPDKNDTLIIDACAAPGNKTTHLASLMSQLPSHREGRSIISCEKDKGRAQILEKMINTAGAEVITTIKAGQDFLRADPTREPWNSATALLLDPSCSGSGIIGRDEAPERVVLPSIPTDSAKASKKRKRGERNMIESAPASAPVQPDKVLAMEEEEEEARSDVPKERLEALCKFQAKLVQHAMSFPNARKITYSTCSIHEEENEHVVANVLGSSVARQFGWRILRRDEQVDGMKRWNVRGVLGSSSSPGFVEEMAEACIRCNKHTSHGTQGFFVAAFVRDQASIAAESEAGIEVTSEDEWQGFEDN